ncbi:MAG: nuclease [Fusobacteriales bacterium]|jgi:hypothetical protein|nr:nuclease [Fusobacteriales bacterium]
MKIVLFFLLFGLGFSCSLLNDPDFYMRKAFETTREIGLENKLYCDKNDKYMIYYYKDSKYLQIGLVDKLQKKENYGDAIKRLQEDSVIIYDIFTQKITVSNRTDDFNGVEFRHYLDMDDTVFMLNKLVVDPDGEVQMLINSQLRETFNNSNMFYYTDDIKY